MGVDFGGNGSMTTFVLKLYFNRYHDLRTAEEDHIPLSKDIDADMICDKFVEFYRMCIQKYGRVDWVFPDSASTTMINSLRSAAKKAELPYRNIKGCRKNEISDRPKTVDKLLNTGRLKINRRCENLRKAIAKTLTYSRTAELQAMSMAKLGYSPARIRKEAMKILNADPKYRKAVAKNTLEYKREIRDTINNITKEAYKANDEIVAGAGNMAWISDLAVWKSVGKELKDNSFLEQLVDSFAAQTAGELKNMTQTTGFKVMSGYEGIENAYRRELDKAVIKICSGTFSQDKVVRDVVHDLAQSGLRSIDFASGYSMQLDTAARLAIRTGCHQLAGKVQDKNIEQTGENLVYVSKHWGARNTGTGHANHEQWQGRVYFIKEGQDYSEEARRIGQDYITDLWRATGYSADGAHESDPTGLYGYNCRHNHYVWFEGSSSMPKEQPQPDPVTINGKTYDYYAMTQKMRSMERNIRALKREKEALITLGEDTTEINAKIRQKTAEYKDFCNTCDVPTATSKLRYECRTSDLKKTQAWKSFDNIVKVSKNDIINVEKTSLYESPNSITQEILKSGGVNRNFYDNEGKQIKQISNHNHGNAKHHPFGEKGEHVHDYIWEDGKLIGRPARELTEEERKENSDIL